MENLNILIEQREALIAKEAEKKTQLDGLDMGESLELSNHILDLQTAIICLDDCIDFLTSFVNNEKLFT